MGNIFGDLWDSFTGAGAKKAIQAGQEQAQGYLTNATDNINQAYGKAASTLDPYVQGGNAFYKRYGDAMGVNGVDALTKVQNEYMNDPIQQALMDRITKANTRAMVGNQMNNSGAATQSLTNALLSNWQNYQQGLSGGSQAGQQAATTQAGVYTGQGDNLATINNQRAGVAIGGANAMAGANNLFAQNLIGAGSAIGSIFGGGKKTA